MEKKDFIIYLLCKNCGNRWRKTLTMGESLYRHGDVFTFIVKEDIYIKHYECSNNVTIIQAMKQYKIICENCGGSKDIVNISKDKNKCSIKELDLTNNDNNN